MTGVDNWTGTRPSLVAEDVERLLRAMDARPRRTGTSAIAAGFGISLRTLYRYWPGRVEWREIDGYRLAFLCRPGYRPVVLDTRKTRVGALVEKLP